MRETGIGVNPQLSYYARHEITALLVDVSSLSYKKDGKDKDA